MYWNGCWLELIFLAYSSNPSLPLHECRLVAVFWYEGPHISVLCCSNSKNWNSHLCFLCTVLILFQAWKSNGFKSGELGGHSADFTTSTVAWSEICKSHAMTDGHSVIPSWCRAPLQAHDPLSCQFQIPSHRSHHSTDNTTARDMIHCTSGPITK
jgi:hypothetical protein